MARTNYARIPRKSLATDLRHEVWFQDYIPSPDGDGGFVDAWIDKTKVWAGIFPVRADQKKDYDSLSGEVTHFVKVRAETDCDIKQRIRYGERFFEILPQPVDIQERGILKHLKCREISRGEV